MENGPVSVSLIVCESVLSEEKTGCVSAIRIMDVLTIGQHSTSARFFVLTYLHSRPFDFQPHVLKVQMVGRSNENWATVADAPDHKFIYGYRLAASGPGSFFLTTEFNLNLASLGPSVGGTYFIQALVDGELAEQTPLTLRRS